MPDTTPALALPFILASQADKHVTLNEALHRLDIMTQCVVESRKVTTEPTSPTNGQTWIVPSGATGVIWSTLPAGTLARFAEGSWRTVSPLRGFRVYIIDELRPCTFDGTAWSLEASTSDSDNRLINGAFQIWQRGGAFSPMAANEFGPDRWRAIHTAAGTPTINWTRVTPTPTLRLPAHCGAALRVDTVTPGTSPVGFEQAIEDVRTLGGRQVCLSFYARANAPIVISPSLEQRFGVGGSPLVVSGFATSAIDTLWTRYEMIVQLPDMVGKTIITATSLALKLTWPAVSASWVEITGLKLEAGRAASPLEMRTEANELLACQRYFFTTMLGKKPAPAQGFEGAIMQARIASGSYYHRMSFRFPIRMRATPVVTFYNPVNAGSQCVDADIGQDCTNSGPLSFGQSADQVTIFTQTPAAGIPGNMLCVNVTASAEL